MIRYCCDACGKEEKLEYISFLSFRGSNGEVCDWDLCPECRDKIKKFVGDIKNFCDSESKKSQNIRVVYDENGNEKRREVF